MCTQKTYLGFRLSTSALYALAINAAVAYHEPALAYQSAISARPSESPPGVLPLARLEQAFWACDYSATVQGVDATPVAFCSAVYEELKNVKFGGDFEELLKWWQQNKVSEHQKMKTVGLQSAYSKDAVR